MNIQLEALLAQMNKLKGILAGKNIYAYKKVWIFVFHCLLIDKWRKRHKNFATLNGMKKGKKQLSQIMEKNLSGGAILDR